MSAIANDGVTRSFNNVVLSDITIFIKGLRFPAHSFFPTAQCDYFKDALTKGGLKKKAVREFHFDKAPPHAYWRMSEYLYEGIYSVEPVAELSELGKYLIYLSINSRRELLTRLDDELIHRHIHAYAVAETFGIEGLERLATNRFKQCMKEEHMDKRFVECIGLIFKCTKVRGNMLRREVIGIVGRHSKRMWGIGPPKTLVCGGNDFAFDFAAKLLEGK